MAIRLVDSETRAKSVQLLFGLAVDLLLNRGKVHGDITTVGDGQRFDDV